MKFSLTFDIFWRFEQFKIFFFTFVDFLGDDSKGNEIKLDDEQVNNVNSIVSDGNVEPNSGELKNSDIKPNNDDAIKTNHANETILHHNGEANPADINNKQDEEKEKKENREYCLPEAI